MSSLRSSEAACLTREAGGLSIRGLGSGSNSAPPGREAACQNENKYCVSCNAPAVPAVASRLSTPKPVGNDDAARRHCHGGDRWSSTTALRGIFTRD